MAPVTRPRTKTTDEGKAAVLKALRAGNFVSTAAALGRVSRATVYQWRVDDPEFAESYRVAIAESENAHVANITTAAIDNWQASAWFLERRAHRQWAKKPPGIVLNVAAGAGLTLPEDAAERATVLRALADRAEGK